MLLLLLAALAAQEAVRNLSDCNSRQNNRFYDVQKIYGSVMCSIKKKTRKHRALPQVTLTDGSFVVYSS